MASHDRFASAHAGLPRRGPFWVRARLAFAPSGWARGVGGMVLLLCGAIGEFGHRARATATDAPTGDNQLAIAHQLLLIHWRLRSVPKPVSYQPGRSVEEG